MKLHVFLKLHFNRNIRGGGRRRGGFRREGFHICLGVEDGGEFNKCGNSYND